MFKRFASLASVAAAAALTFCSAGAARAASGYGELITHDTHNVQHHFAYQGHFKTYLVNADKNSREVEFGMVPKWEKLQGTAPNVTMEVTAWPVIVRANGTTFRANRSNTVKVISNVYRLPSRTVNGSFAQWIYFTDKAHKIPAMAGTFYLDPTVLKLRVPATMADPETGKKVRWTDSGLVRFKVCFTIDPKTKSCIVQDAESIG